jgi:hypothetical protein
MRECKRCGVNIEHKRSDAIFCSKKCKKDHWHRQQYPIPMVRLTNEERKIRHKIRKKRWQTNNRDKYLANMRRYCKERYYNDVNYRLAINLRNRLNIAIDRGYKAGSAVRDLGCIISELKTHLESLFEPGMTWDNYGKWHIDHKKPLNKFDLSNYEDLKEACNYKNLQPLWAEDNIAKSDSYDKS